MLETIGISNVSPPPLNLQVRSLFCNVCFAVVSLTFVLVFRVAQRIVEETSASEPILFVATAGADPSLELEEFAMKVVGRNNFQVCVSRFADLVVAFPIFIPFAL